MYVEPVHSGSLRKKWKNPYPLPHIFFLPAHTSVLVMLVSPSAPEHILSANPAPLVHIPFRSLSLPATHSRLLSICLLTLSRLPKTIPLPNGYSFGTDSARFHPPLFSLQPPISLGFPIRFHISPTFPIFSKKPLVSEAKKNIRFISCPPHIGSAGRECSGTERFPLEP